jgi:hypothetical protein
MRRGISLTAAWQTSQTCLALTQDPQTLQTSVFAVRSGSKDLAQLGENPYDLQGSTNPSCAVRTPPVSMPVLFGSSDELQSLVHSLAANPADESHSRSGSSATTLNISRYPAEMLGDNQALAPACKRVCDSERSWRHSATHSASIDSSWARQAAMPLKSGNTVQHRGLKASKSESHILFRERCYNPRHALEEYSLGSGNPYGWDEQPNPSNVPSL